MSRASAVLLVDDEPVVLDSLRRQMRLMCGDGLQVECAESVSEAWEVMAEMQAEGVSVLLIISDWLMPLIRGDAFLEEVKARFPEVKRVMLTGQADGAALRRVRDGGFVDRLLFKPWSVQELAEVVGMVGTDG